MDNTVDFGIKMGKTSSVGKKIIYCYSFGKVHKVTTIPVLSAFVFYSDPALKCSWELALVWPEDSMDSR